MNTCAKAKEKRIKNLTHKIQLLFKQAVTKQEACSFASNLINNYDLLPKKLASLPRSLFLRLVYNAWPLKGRIRAFVKLTSSLCTFCDQDHETRVRCNTSSSPALW